MADPKHDPIDLAEWESEYKAGTKAKSEKLVRRFKKATGIMAAACTDDAIKRWIEHVVSDIAVAVRKSKMAAITDAELHRLMEEVGKKAYEAKTAAKAATARAAFADYAREIEAILPTLAPREIDAETNVINRVVPIAKRLQELKRRKYGL